MRNAFHSAACYSEGMNEDRHAWHLKAWLKACGVSQEQLAKELEMNKAKVSLLANEKQRYDQDDISRISLYLDIEPYELLMHPREAEALRRFRSSAEEVASRARDAEVITKDEFTDLRLSKVRRRETRRRTGTDD